MTATMTPTRRRTPATRIKDAVKRLRTATLDRNLGIVDAREAGLSYGDISKAAGLSKAAVMDIAKQEDRWRAGNVNGQARGARLSDDVCETCGAAITQSQR